MTVPKPNNKMRPAILKPFNDTIIGDHRVCTSVFGEPGNMMMVEVQSATMAGWVHLEMNGKSEPVDVRIDFLKTLAGLSKDELRTLAEMAGRF